jgi:diketogulonate reductase-like aldo/keto reductase
MEPLRAFPDSALDLPGGGRMPLVGFGTWQLRDDQAHDATLFALKAGYRHLDTATMYDNEREVGAAIAESGISRDSIFVTTKLPPDRAGDESKVLAQSLDLLGLDHLDLWLIHWPPSDSIAMWRAFAAARQDGLARDVGVSNYSLAQLDQLAEATGVMPAVNQIPWSPLLFDQALLDGHRRRGVVLEGYSALKNGAMDHPVIVEVAGQVGRTPAQVIVRWHLQHEVVVIPKSSVPERITANAEVAGFTLDDEQMAAIDALGAPRG